MVEQGKAVSRYINEEKPVKDNYHDRENPWRAL